MKLIDTELLLEEISKGATVEDLKKLVTECKGVPVTVDAVPVVRCKDCKNAGRKMGTHYHCEQQMSWHEEEYFCSFAERREP